MRSARLMMSLCLLLAAASAHAQLYKWVGPDGKVTYSDSPPPQSAKQVETKSFSGGTAIDTANLPYELAQAVKAHPVTLYTTPNCAACDAGRALLNQRGIPFSEKTIVSNEDQDVLKRISGGNQLPFLTVGHDKHGKFSPDAWNLSLTAAGYPESSKLPANYANPPAQSAAPKVVERKQEQAEAPQPEDVPPPAGNAPPGFRF